MHFCQANCDSPNSLHRDIVDVLNMFKFHSDIGVIFFAEKIAPKSSVGLYSNMKFSKVVTF